MKILNKPTWQDQRPLKAFPKLNANLNCDVVIAGGGLAGILSAYLLAKKGYSVALLEADRLLSGATQYTTAFLTQIYDTDTADSIKIYGTNKTKLIWESHGEAINLIERIAKEENIDCEFTRCSNYSYGNSEEDFKLLKEESKAMKSLGFRVALKNKNDLNFRNYGYIETMNQAKFHPIKFAQGVVSRLEEMGVEIFEKSPVEKISGKGPVKAGTKYHSVKAMWAITATYDPLNNPKETFGKKGMYVSYVFEVQVPKGIFKEGIYEDLENPYHYFRIDRMGSHDRMIIGGEDNRKEIEFRKQKNFNALSDYLSQIMEGKKYRIAKKWSGYILEPSDGLPLIGEFRPHQLIATAFSGNGMTYSAISAMMLRDALIGKKNRWAPVYNPVRTPTLKQLLVKARDYGEEFIKGAARNTLKF
jgi:glycine/D-amino acid oxidase-like deaminating enzyme